MPLLGCVADDFTGATDMAGALALGGMRTLVVLDINAASSACEFDAVIVALKSRTAPVNEAVQTSLEALHWLVALGCKKFYFKYCSTFDSLPTGNIGPVIDSFLEDLRLPFALVCPATPDNGRTVYQSNLFVDEKPLSESNMRNHPLNPMTDSNLVRLLAPQTRHQVGSIYLATVRHGVGVTQAAISELQDNGRQIGVADALDEPDLDILVSAGIGSALLTGAAGLAKALPGVFRAQEFLPAIQAPAAFKWSLGYSAILSGSCSEMTQKQVAHARKHMPVYDVDVLCLAEGKLTAREILAWARGKLPSGPILVSATANRDSVHKIQQKFGVKRAGALVEELLAEVAQGLACEGVQKLIVAGGETSGAVVKALEVVALEIGQQIDPGVHWSMGVGKSQIALALKSGNFGTEEFFTKAWELL